MSEKQLNIPRQISNTLNSVNKTISENKELKINVVVPNSILIEFKEALIFALLGVLKMRNEENSLSSVTGSSKNLKTGTIYDS